MEDSQPPEKQPEKAKRSNELWNIQETEMLLRLVTDGIKQGWRDANGSMSKLTVEKKILPDLNSKLGCEKTFKHYGNKMRTLKIRYNSMQELIRFSSGFGWDSKTKKFTAPDQVWDEYEKAHPNRKNMRNETFEDYEDLRLIFDQSLASGKNVVGLGDSTDAPTFGVEDNVAGESYTGIFGNTINIDDSQSSGFPDSPIQRQPQGPAEKLPPRKRTKSGECGDSGNSNIDGSRMEKSFNEMIVISSQVVSLIQQREERQQREANAREAEKRKNNIWEAIKEIIDLEENVRYNTLNEIHRLGMKEVFVSMSIEERMGWIRRTFIVF